MEEPIGSGLPVDNNLPNDQPLDDSDKEETKGEWTWVSELVEVSVSDSDEHQSTFEEEEYACDLPQPENVNGVTESEADQSELIESGENKGEDKRDDMEGDMDEGGTTENGSTEDESEDSFMSDIEHYVKRRQFIINVDSVPRRGKKIRSRERSNRREKESRSVRRSGGLYSSLKYQRRRVDNLFSQLSGKSKTLEGSEDSDEIPRHRVRQGARSMINLYTDDPILPIDERKRLKYSTASGDNILRDRFKRGEDEIDRGAEKRDSGGGERKSNEKFRGLGSTISNVYNIDDLASHSVTTTDGRNQLNKLIEESQKKATQAQCRANLYNFINVAVSFFIIVGNAVIGTIVAVTAFSSSSTAEIPNAISIFVVAGSYSIAAIKSVHEIMRLGQRGVFFKFMSNQIRKIIRTINESVFYLQSDYEILHFCNNVQQEIDDLEFSAFKMTAGPLSLGSAPDLSQATQHAIPLPGEDMV